MTTPAPPPRITQRSANVVRWLAPESFEWALALLYCSVLISYLVRNLPFISGQAFPWLPAAVLIAVLSFAFGLDRWEHVRYGSAPPLSIAIAVLVARILVVEIAMLIDKTDATYFLYLVVPFTAAITLGSQAAWLIGTLLWARMSYWLFTIAAMTEPALDVLQAFVLMPVGIVFVLVLGRLIVAERASRVKTEQLLSELEQSHAQLTTYAAQVEALTLTAERNRLARDIHDSLGHYLTTINVQLRTANAFRARDPERSQHAIQEATRLTQTALDDVRRSVGMLRETGEIFLLHSALHKLIAPLENDQLHVDLSIVGDLEGYPLATQMALFRAAQEALTNVQRHANARNVWVTLASNADTATLSIRDDGVGFAPVTDAHKPTHGLQGIHERLALVGGQVQITSTPGSGTIITITAPRQGIAVHAT